MQGVVGNGLHSGHEHIAPGGSCSCHMALLVDRLFPAAAAVVCVSAEVPDIRKAPDCMGLHMLACAHQPGQTVPLSAPAVCARVCTFHTRTHYTNRCA